jgi:hypothetical protein
MDAQTAINVAAGLVMALGGGLLAILNHRLDKVERRSEENGTLANRTDVSVQALRAETDRRQHEQDERAAQLRRDFVESLRDLESRWRHHPPR